MTAGELVMLVVSALAVGALFILALDTEHVPMSDSDHYVGRLGPEPSRSYVTTGDKSNGYPCPKDGTTLTLLDGGAWCSQCHTAWREIGEIDLADLDALPEGES